MITRAIALIVLAICLWHDFNRDKGQHKPANVVHLISLGILVYIFSGVIGSLIFIFNNFHSTNEHFSQDYGWMPGWLNISYYYFQYLLQIVLLLVSYLMAVRIQIARRIFIFCLPLLLISYGYNLISILIDSHREELILETVLKSYMRSMIALGVIIGVFVLLYTRTFMRAFFLEKEEKNDDPKLLDDHI